MPLFSTSELSAFILPGEHVIEELKEENERLRKLAVTLKEKVDALSAAGNFIRQQLSAGPLPSPRLPRRFRDIRRDPRTAALLRFAKCRVNSERNVIQILICALTSAAAYQSCNRTEKTCCDILGTGLFPSLVATF